MSLHAMRFPRPLRLRHIDYQRFTGEKLPFHQQIGEPPLLLILQLAGDLSG